MINLAWVLYLIALLAGGLAIFCWKYPKLRWIPILYFGLALALAAPRNRNTRPSEPILLLGFLTALGLAQVGYYSRGFLSAFQATKWPSVVGEILSTKVLTVNKTFLRWRREVYQAKIIDVIRNKRSAYLRR